MRDSAGGIPHLIFAANDARLLQLDLPRTTQA
jgi:hypothetical protein